MGKYGEAAVQAVTLFREGAKTDIAEAWETAVARIFPGSTSLQDKGCPKSAFLGLCSDGVLVDIPAGDYCWSNKNKEYAIKAVDALKANRFLVNQPELLWRKVAGPSKSHNHQMDVVVALWNAGLVRD